MYISRYTLMALFLTAICCWANCAYAQQPPASGNITDYYKLPDDGNIHPVKSRYDYKPLAEEITAGCATNFERIKAIYAWITSHIEYDTSYKIRTADECLKKQKGVCQAYCELFYLLGKAVGIRVETIMGKAKDQTGFVNPNGHGWLFAYTSNDRGILMDPTWGAGSVDGDRFVPEENCWEWFNVAPEWMILSHFPQKASKAHLDAVRVGSLKDLPAGEKRENRAASVLQLRRGYCPAVGYPLAHVAENRQRVYVPRKNAGGQGLRHRQPLGDLQEARVDG